MSKRPSEGSFGKALRDVDLVKVVYRPPDAKGGEGVSNWRPCDYMVWLQGRANWGTAIRVDDETVLPVVTFSAWFECKDVDAVNAFPLADIRPSQWAGMRDAARVGIPYWLAVWWRRHREWTISDARQVLAYAERRDERPTSIPRSELIAMGIQTPQVQLTSMLKALLLGELD